jgi:hypothetical protein
MNKSYSGFGLLAVFLTAIVVLFACNKDSEGSSDNFDRKKMLENYADNLIIPAFDDLTRKTEALSDAINNFTNEPSELTLQLAQESWKFAYLSWQYANAYNFGPGGEEGLKKSLVEEIGTFPVSASDIDSMLVLNSYNLTNLRRDTRGFLALDYLLFSLDNNNSAVLNKYIASENARNNLKAITAHLLNSIKTVNTAWNGAFRNTFVENAGTSVGSSTSMLFNEFVKSYESIKNFKFGLPIGMRPGQTQTEPARVEAYYSGVSVEMAKAHLTAIELLWNGTSKIGVDGIGFKEYLESVEGGSALVAATEAQLTVLNQKMNALSNDRLSDQVNSNLPELMALYVELQKHTRYFKSDMASLLGIAITFSSSDGD